MRILIADSGATKTTWASVANNEHSIISTFGMNPLLKADVELEAILFDELFSQLSSKEFDQIWFYGAGCREWKNSDRVMSLLKEAFPKSDIKLKTDVEGAGLSSFGDGTGIVVISGTGSSAGFMKNGEMMDIMYSRAYPEGDFGSGCHIGALVLRDYFDGDAPDFIKEVIKNNHSLSFDQLFLQFQDPNKSKQIAAKAMRDVAIYKDTDYLKDKAIVTIETLLEQLRNHFKEGLTEFPIKLIGSTAYHFQTVFRKVFHDASIEILDIQQNPIQGLIAYHSLEND